MEWLINNKDWVFSGIGVLVITLMVNFIWGLQKLPQSSVENTTIHQSNNGTGDNIGGDKVVNKK